MNKIIIQHDEHVNEETGAFEATTKWEIREVWPDGSSEVIDCCLTKQEAVTGARYEFADSQIEVIA